MIQAHWSPYIIPATPDVSEGEKYALSAKVGAVSSKNPSEFLEWKEIIPKGLTLGDLLYWDPSAGDNGDWVVLAAPIGEGLKVLASNGGAPFWNETEDCD